MSRWMRIASLLAVAVAFAPRALPSAEPAPAAAAQAKRQAAFPSDLVQFVPAAKNPVFQGGGDGAWDQSLRERGWILRETDGYHLWYTGYDGTREGQKKLGYATSPDGIAWTRFPANPIYQEHWVEDMMIVPRDGTYYMFAEGLNDQAQLLTSTDKVQWQRIGTLDIRDTAGKPLTPGPYGTPTAWFENETWYLFYERGDQAVWLATSRDLKVWKNVQDDPVLARGPEAHDRVMIALNQIIKHDGQYYSYYHGTGTEEKPRIWTTDVAVSRDLIHWRKYDRNPLLPERDNRSSGMLVHDGQRWRLYTMHEQVNLYANPVAE